MYFHDVIPQESDVIADRALSVGHKVKGRPEVFKLHDNGNQGAGSYGCYHTGLVSNGQV